MNEVPTRPGVGCSATHCLFLPSWNTACRRISFYLPEGEWFDYASGKPVSGGRDISVP